MSKTPKIIVVGLGPAGDEFVTSQTQDLLSRPNVWLRTSRHLAARLAVNARSFDYIYDSADKIEEVYVRIVDELVEKATELGEVVYAVPGSPLVAEATVDLLRNDGRVVVDIQPAMSFLDLVWNRLEVDPLALSPRLIDGHCFAIEAAEQRGPLLVAQCDSEIILSEIKLAFELQEPEKVVILHHLGLNDEKVFEVDWNELDRVVKPDHLTSLWIPQISAPVGYELARVRQVARRLRNECPWDIEQTHSSLSRHLIEESYELIDAINSAAENDVDLIEELGDVMFQIFAHCAIAEEEGRFNIADVAQVVADKLIERHPHVYGDVVAQTADDVVATWEANKKASKGRVSVMEGIPSHLPALLYGWKVLRKAQSSGIEIVDENYDPSSFGEKLLFLVAEAMRSGVDPEEDLRNTVNLIRKKFEAAENLASAQGIDLAKTDKETANSFWNHVSVKEVD